MHLESADTNTGVLVSLKARPSIANRLNDSKPWLQHAVVWTIVFAVVYRFMPDVFALDDAYITLHSARVLLTGKDPVYGVPALVGITCPPYVALVALLLSLHLPALQIATALG